VEVLEDTAPTLAVALLTLVVEAAVLATVNLTTVLEVAAVEAAVRDQSIRIKPVALEGRIWVVAAVVGHQSPISHPTEVLAL